MDSLRLYAQGEAFRDDKLSLREAIKLLDTTRMLLDTGLVIATGREKLTADLRDNINYEVQLKTGSIDAYITLGEIMSDALPLLLPLAVDLKNYLEVIAKTLKRAKALIEWLGKKRNDNKHVVIKVDVKDSPGAIVLVANDGDIYNASQQDFKGALRLFRPFKDMSLLCDGKRINNIDYYQLRNGAEVEKSISMDPSSKDLYRAETLIENLTVKVVGTVFDLNTKSGKGKIELSDGTVYNIQIAKMVDIHKFTQLAYDKGPIECTAKPIMKIVNGVPTLSGYELTDFNPPSQEKLTL